MVARRRKNLDRSDTRSLPSSSRDSVSSRSSACRARRDEPTAEQRVRAEATRRQAGRPNRDVIRVQPSVASISASGGRRAKRLAAPRTRGSSAPRIQRTARSISSCASKWPLLDHRGPSRCARASTIAQPASAIGRARSPRERALASLAVPASTRPMIPCAMAESLNIENAT